MPKDKDSLKQNSTEPANKLLARRWKDCSEAGMPLCLESALEIMFGNIGRGAVKEMAEKDFASPATSASTPGEIFELYERYFEAWNHRLGKESTKVLEHQVRTTIQSMACTECPIYQRKLPSAAIVRGVVESVPKPERSPKVLDRVGTQMGSLRGKISLFEANPAVSYETKLREIAFELSSLKDSVYVFTSKGSSAYQAVSDLDQIRLFAKTSSVNYVFPADKPSEVLIPSHDAPLLLDIIDKAVKAAATANVAFILDSLSDMILELGFKETYQFVKQALEICSNHNVTFVAVIFQNAHDLSVLNAMRSLFSNHFVEEPKIELKVSKFSQ